MKTCHRCARHMLRVETDCPFCGAAQSCAPAWPLGCSWVLVGALGAVACGSDDAANDDYTSTTRTTSDTASDTTGSSVSSSASGTSVMTSDPSTSSSSDDEGDVPVSFYAIDPDGGTRPLACDIWAQDCPEGEKCAPIATTGSQAFDASRCTPVDPDPAANGTACTVTGGPFSGIDDCGLGAMCIGADLEALDGICVALCEGSAANPVCSDPTTACAVFDPNAFAVCLTTCDILADECPEGEVCMTVADADVCVPE